MTHSMCTYVLRAYTYNKGGDVVEGKEKCDPVIDSIHSLATPFPSLMYVLWDYRVGPWLGNVIPSYDQQI